MDNILKCSTTGDMLSNSILEIVKPNLNNINSLNLQLCENESKAIKKIQSTTFKNCNSITELIFKSEKVIHWNVRTFFLKSNVELIQSVNKLNNLKVLSLTNCGIDDISEKFNSNSPFSYLANLTDLDLSSNKITKVNKECFKGLFKLKFLNLSDNTINGSEEFPFDYLESLESLNLSKNPIIKIHRNLFGRKLKNLKELNISNCSFNFIHYHSFRYLEKLHEIHLPVSFRNKTDRFDAYGLKKECIRHYDLHRFDIYEDEEYDDYRNIDEFDDMF